ncbi:retinoid-inducible serine carboxypeptidase-like isoform X1 [Drosophila sulfurigaster albostrigata]|uniref:retinoid-inducible serine carboxypeptidase-like isoform X1 n=1 Tax=Drosophila sulfurigaster albostrigata TaxID=89887 RepID=UPI002D21D680|nr:retinoid-inducible serine carboxypeptidase-like isoform X1 [Drosophila sulfurigaster albostrigata]
MKLKNYNAITAYAVFLLQLINCAAARRGFGPGEQDWNYVEVRKGAHLFYWLHYTTANVSSFYERPLVIWLQGGPGVASTGCGCFEQLGPFDIEGQPRASNWVQHMNVLFIDSPVGTGFSYVESFDKYAVNNKQIALDLVTLMSDFLRSHPEFQSVPLHIFSESYGGKMAPEFALELYRAQQRGEVQCQLKSVVVGNPFISPVDTILSYAPYMLQLGIVDYDGFKNISRVASEFSRLIYTGEMEMAVIQNVKLQQLIEEIIGNFVFYNTQWRSHEDDDHSYGEGPKLSDFMINNVTKALNLTHMTKWAARNVAVYDELGSDIVKPAVHIVTRLLDETTLRVGVYSGVLDLICATPGTVNWINRMSWRGKQKYVDAIRQPFRSDGYLEGYEKQGGNFSMFWVLRAGHMVQQDNPAAMSHILREFTNYG